MGGRRGFLVQAALLAATLALVALVAADVLQNMARAGLTPGFGFLGRPANFEIGESLIPYSASDSFARALLVGLLNTIMVAIAGCALATILGVTLGVARLSGNLLLKGLVQAYVEVVRNTPLLLQLFFWSATMHALPAPRRALMPVEGVFLTNRGVFFPWIAAEGGLAWTVLAGFTVAVATAGYAAFRRPRNARLLLSAAALLAAASLGAALFGDPGLSIDAPRLGTFNVSGGFGISPEFLALLAGLTVHSSAIISEVVRAGLQSVPEGQWEAAHSLGLSRGQALRLVVMPQALRVIVPLMISSYLDLTKNSSLAVAIGFPDLVSVISTSANQSGHAVETILIMVAAYLALNLSVSTVMNRYDAKLAARGFAAP
ncbi:amino acid ABC transporter permease [Hansschlegelia plantiphila]|uniref:Amino acid ABC transporter permease n=1 Tax=Hansschlegelia plantiphila TaxID=374655 RepID=A0A9W6MXF7_9HYPH|nr:ABC transporter permease subunit [Hansschlegelia plantiphila]GLK69850.1 amino acid ABC transporter permease [Hansschlegelia plantiphila]